jgi:tRNA C32,U32 (ribose-2'-O)-methylase TrmJ
MAERPSRPDTRPVVEPDPLLDEIASLLGQEPAGDDVARLERTLTDGYARALSLETERSRLQKEIGRLAAADAAGRAAQRQVRALTRRAEARAEELQRLRTLLASLRRRYSRAAAVNRP